MTEEEWLTTNDAQRLLSFVKGIATLRKARLLRVAPARLNWTESASYEQYQFAIEAGEKHADGEVSDEKLQQLSGEMYRTISTRVREINSNSSLKIATFLSLAAVQNSRMISSFSGVSWNEAIRHIGGDLPTILHCLFGNPFRPVAFDPRWRTDTAVGIAQQMYDARDFNAMPILADALQDAGCEHTDILNHCRNNQEFGPVSGASSGPNATHVRGCWVVDLVLGKS